MRKVFVILVVMFALMGCGTDDSDNGGGGDNTPAVAEDTEDTVEDSETDTTTVDTTCNVAIESKIDGVFRGWRGDTVVNLINRQTWKQVEYYYHYHYSYGADVVIYSVISGCKMVVGDLKAVLVERIK